ncbi:hypothetical protein CSUI_000461 [Cystoisospora suis]|uniref:Uncharacterized protein n=1 Tax=Cystoisospora suis TaxID=483139 RepID=A0A2C6LGQ7_9APIC|nr:hypothetical protein CSUI_000461 [Cystoisospora suis]
MQPPFCRRVPARLFQGQLQQPDLTLDLPLLQTCRPHFLPPSLLLPTSTFLFPRPKIRHDTVLDVSFEYVFDCSYLPQHPHLLVCTCTPKGFTVVLDIETGQAVQHFFPPQTSSSSSRLDDGFSCCGTSRLVSSYPSVTCAHMHGDPSCPLLFSGNSAGDVSAYDLRFAGSAIGMYRHPTLLLENAHDGIVSAIRAGGGGGCWTGGARNPLSLPDHVFFSSGLQDNWIRSFDLRFPFHYSTASGGCGEGSGGPLGVSVQNVKKSRGRVPYPIDAVQLNPGCTYTGGSGKNAFCTSAFSSRKLWREEQETRKEENRRLLNGSKFLSLREKDKRASRRIIASPFFPSHRRKNESNVCVCCSASGSACGVASIDLSPDGTVLAVAQLRAVHEEKAEEADDVKFIVRGRSKTREKRERSLMASKNSRSSPLSTSSPFQEGEFLGDRMPMSFDRTDNRRGKYDEKRLETEEGEHVVLRWGDEDDEEEQYMSPESSAQESRVRGMEENTKTRMCSTQGALVNKPAIHLQVSPSPDNARTDNDSSCCLSPSPPSRVSPSVGDLAVKSFTREFLHKKRKQWRVEGEVTILSIPDRLKALKSFAVADACAFTTVEFSCNGKYLLLSQGVANTGYCVDCRRCFCCCSCECIPFFSQREEEKKKGASDNAGDDEGKKSEGDEDEEKESERSESEEEDETTRKKRDEEEEKETHVDWGYGRYFCLWDEDTEDDAEEDLLRALHEWKSTRAKEKKECTDDGSGRNGATLQQDARGGRGEEFESPSEGPRPMHRAQLVNIIQSNRIVILKTPGDGAIAYSDSFLVEHSFKNEDPRSSSKSYVEEPRFRSPLREEYALESSVVQVCRFSSPCLSSFSLSRLPLRLRMFSPYSSLLEARRRAFWVEPSSVFLPSRTPSKKRDQCPSSSSCTGISSSCDDTDVNLDATDKTSACEHSSIKNVSESWHPSLPEGTCANFHCPASSGVVSGDKNEVSEKIGYNANSWHLERDREAPDEQKFTSDNIKPSTPFPRCHPQISQFLCACGPLHPQWGRLDCMDSPFLCSLWGGLVVGLGGSRFYPGLKLWHATTGTVLSWTEGPLATEPAIRCLRGHPTLSTGLLATGGSLSAPHRSRRTGPSGPYSGRTLSRRSSWPSVTLWSLMHRDLLLYAALENRDAFDLTIDSSDEDSVS